MVFGSRKEITFEVMNIPGFLVLPGNIEEHIMCHILRNFMIFDDAEKEMKEFLPILFYKTIQLVLFHALCPSITSVK